MCLFGPLSWSQLNCQHLLTSCNHKHAPSRGSNVRLTIELSPESRKKKITDFGPGAKGRVWGSYVVLKAPLTPVPLSQPLPFPHELGNFLFICKRQFKGHKESESASRKTFASH